MTGKSKANSIKLSMVGFQVPGNVAGHVCHLLVSAMFCNSKIYHIHIGFKCSVFTSIWFIITVVYEQ